MKQFFKYFFASGLAIIVFGLIFLFLSIGIISAKFGSGPAPINVKKNSILQLKLDMPISERTFAEFKMGMQPEMKAKTGMKNIIDNIKFAKTDDKIKGIYLDLSSVQMGMATMEEIRNALLDFKESKKFIVSYSENYSQGAYYLASVSDEIYLYPTGSLDWKGFASEKTFLKNMMDKLEVDMQVIRGSNNKFKSAVEPFLTDKMSDANREQTKKYMFSFWNHIVKGVGEQRNISTETLNEIADGLLVYNSQKAIDYKLVTASKYEDEVFDILKEKAGIEEEKDLVFIKLGKYSKHVKTKTIVKNRKNPKNIAVVYATGEIKSGKGGHEVIGSETTVKSLRKARENDSIKVIVLRVNSPGGSALASDVIWREIEQIKKDGKKVVVSMGNLAASGGYYISCNADRIFAQPNTITGSIGVFGMIPNAEKFFKNKIGVTFDRVVTNKHAGMMTINKPLSEEEYLLIQKEVDRIYNDFITKVAEGRGMTKQEVDSIGQGRVWAGTDALENNLVDEIGGLNDAIKYAAKIAELDEYRIQEYPIIKENPFMKLMEQLNEKEENASVFSTSTENKIVKEILTQMDAINKISTNPNDRIQARMPYILKIK